MKKPGSKALEELEERLSTEAAIEAILKHGAGLSVDVIASAVVDLLAGNKKWGDNKSTMDDYLDFR
jgi:hypothetical protein